MNSVRWANSAPAHWAAGIAGGVTILILLHVLLGGSDGIFQQRAAKFLLDIDSGERFNWFSLQNIMWIVFCIGLADATLRYKESRRAFQQLNERYLPEEDGVVLQQKDLGPIFRRVKEPASRFYLPAMVLQCVLQFQSTRSVAQANEVLTSQAGLLSHQLDLRYTALRYIYWLIPTLGFIGTVYGISIALNTAADISVVRPDDPTLLPRVTADLAVAFYTTLLALFQSALLVLLTQAVQQREEKALNRSVQYCLTNLINRLFVAGE